MRHVTLPSALLLLAVLALGAGPAAAEEAPGAQRMAPTLAPGTMDLLPLDDFAWQDFNREHGQLLGRLRALGKRVAGPAKKLQKRKNKNDADGKKLRAEIRRLQVQLSALRARLTDELIEAGVDGSLIAYMNKAPTGPRRVERYAYGLVLLLEDLGDEQRRLFERVVAQMDGAFLALRAQKERTNLTLKQAQIEKDEARTLLRTFDRQEGLIDQRFWQLTDYVLTRDQRVALWHMLPRPLKKKSQAVEHVYALPGLTPTQATRLKALFTEIEHESSPDQAAVKRINAALQRDREVAREERLALTKERGEAYGRLGALRRYAAQATREILTEEQWLEWEAIPPRVNTNDRRGNFKRVLEGFEPSPSQTRRIQELQREQRTRLREIRRKTQEIRKQGEDYGSDSPQMMGMQMEMQGMKAEGERSARELIGRIFAEVLTPQQISRWVMGHYGYRK